MRWQFTGLVLFILTLQFSELVAQTPGSFYAIGLGGRSAHVRIPDDSSLNVTGSITIEAWVKPDSFKAGNNDNCILSKHGTNGGYDLRCNKNGGVNFRFGTSAGWKFIVSTTKLKQGEWHHVAGTFNGDSICIYVNGQLERVKQHTGRIGTSYGLSAKIGEFSRSGISGLPGGNFDGQIDEVRLWNAALSPEQIAQWMCVKLSKGHPHYNSLKANWRFDEATGSSIGDKSSFGNDGTSYSTNWFRSGAPLGDTAIFSANGTFQYTTASGDAMDVKSLLTLSKGAYLYHVRQPSFDTEMTTGTMVLDSQYFGFFSLDSSVFEYDLDCAYNSARQFNKSGECHLDLVGKKLRTDTEWNETMAKLDLVEDSLHLQNTGLQEVQFGKYYDQRKVKYINNDTILCANEQVTLVAYGNSTYSFQWYRNGKLLAGDTLNKITVGDSASYYATAQRSTTCKYQSISRSIRTIKIPKVQLQYLKPQCEYVDTFVLGGGKPVGGKYLGWLVVQDSMILPSSFSPGSYPLFYSFTDSNNCTNVDTQNFIIQAKPKAIFSGKSHICDNKDSLHLKLVNPPGGIILGSGVNNNIFYTDSIKSSVSQVDLTYFYSDSVGCLDTAYGKLEVLPSSQIIWKPLGDTCENDGPIKLVTNAKPSSFSGTGVQNDFFYPALAGKGKHMLYTTFSNTYGCISQDSNSIEVHEVSQATFSLNDSVCHNADSLQLKGAIPAGGQFSGQGADTNGYFYPNSTSAGEKQIAYIYTNAQGCMDTAYGSILILDTTVLTTSTVPALCNNSAPLKLDHVNPSGGTYLFNGLADSFFRASDQLPGIYDVKYRYANSNGCISTAYVEIEVLKPTEVRLELETTKVCNNGDSVELLLTPTTGGLLLGKGVRNGFVIPNLLDSGMHEWFYTYTDSTGCTFSDSATLQILKAVTPKLSIDSAFCSNYNAIKLLEQGSPRGGTFSIDNTLSKKLNPKELSIGTHFLIYSYIAQNGCKDSTSKVISINEAPPTPTMSLQQGVLYSSANSGNQWYYEGTRIDTALRNSFKPEKTGYYQVEVSNQNCSSISDSVYYDILSSPTIDRKTIQLYPNPVSDMVFIRAEKENIREVHIRDIKGLSVLHFKVSPIDKLEFNSQHLVPGVYWLVLKTESGRHYYVRFLKV